MDCGDAGHILVSKRVADDLEQYPHWRPLLHDLGEHEVKHGVRLTVFNLYTDELGNPELPEKFSRAVDQGKMTASISTPAGKIARPKWGLVGAAILIIGALAAGALVWSHRGGSTLGIRAPAPAGSNVIAPAKSIAVLPFANLSSEKENAYFADGVQDEILTDLAKIADLKVISRTSVMQYKSSVARNMREIGRQLGVAHLLEGSVQRAGGKVRVNAQLIDARTDGHLWAQVYDRPLNDVFAIQSEIAKAIADQLRAKLSPSEKTAIERPPTRDVAAFDLYSRGKTLSRSLSINIMPILLEAVDVLNQAIARDPSFFEAYCQLASTHDQLYFLGNDHTPARLALAEAAIQAAFRLRPDAGEAHLARAENLYRGYLDYDGALAEIDIARRTLPNNPHVSELMAFIKRRQGKQEEALHHLTRALELDPRNSFTLQQIAFSYSLLRRYSELAQVLDRALSINPNDVDTQITRALVAYDEKADTRPVHETFASIQKNNPDKFQSLANTRFFCALLERDPVTAAKALDALGENGVETDAVYLNRQFCEGLIARMTKDEARARIAFTAARVEQEKTVQTQPNYGPAICVLGMIDAALGRKEEALREGRRAVELLPVAKDSVIGANMVELFAMIAAWVGEKDLACEQLAIVTRLPGTLSYGQLKLLPNWDPLRGYPRFEKIVQSLAPK
jgi:TolB-like protein/Tfp pilus assembly protein PilF